MKSKITKRQKQMLMDGKSLSMGRKKFSFNAKMKEDMKEYLDHEWTFDTDTRTVIIGDIES